MIADGPARSERPGAVPSRREAAAFLLGAFAIRAFVLLLDATPRFFLGDSESYLFTAFGRWIPPDRSWIYGLAINALIRATRSLTAILVVQSAVSAVLCAGVAVLCRTLGVRRSIAWAALVATSVDPQLLYYDRSILTDQLGTAAIWLAIAASVVALARGALGWALAAMLSFWCATILRTALAPLVALVPAAIVVLALLRWRAEARTDAGPSFGARRRLRAAAVLALGVVVGLGAYARVNHLLFGAPPSLNPRSGYFLLGVMAPILAAEDFEGSGVAGVERVLEESQHRRRDLRNAQVFSPEGIARRLEGVLGDWRKVSSVGSRAARQAVLRDPAGFAALVAANARDYLTPSVYRRHFDIALGLDRELSDRLVQLLEPQVREPVSAGMPSRPSALLRWMRVTVWSLPALVMASVLLSASALASARAMGADAGDACRVLALAVYAHFLTVFALSVEVVPRYLLPLSPMLVTLIALQAERWSPGGKRRVESGVPGRAGS